MQVKDYFEVIQKDISAHPIVLYMKGTRMTPYCGFSARVVDILETFKVPFETRNVLEDDHLREAIKEFSDWPTLPQLYIQGEFIGGCDIISELYESKELQSLIEDISK